MMTQAPNSTWGPGELLKYEQDCAAREVRDVPGRVLLDVLLPARGFLPAPTLKAGQVMRIIDVEGQQVADLILYDLKNLKNLSSMNNTVLINKNWKITKGHAFYSKFGDRMATIIEDTVGTNVVTGGFCNPGLNRVRYGVEGTHTCQANLAASMGQYHLSIADIEEGCWCAFMNVAYEPDGRLEIRAPISKPNDYLDMRADMDIIVAISNCPSEHNPCNAWNPTPLRIMIETVAGYEARTWAGVGVPKGTPTRIILKLNREVNDGLANPAIRTRLADIGTIPMVFTPDEFGAFIAAETEKWGKVVRSAGIKPE